MNIDFTRHIVNPILSKFIDVKKGEHVKILNEIRKVLGEMEDKYKFSSFGGEPGRLSGFLAGSDFDLFAKIFKTYGLQEALIKILEETKEAYKNDEEIVKATSLRLLELKRDIAKEDASSEQIFNLDRLLIMLKNKIPSGEITSKGNTISVKRGDGFSLKIRWGKKAIALSIKSGINPEDYASAMERIEKIIDCFK
ncbi:MAG: hypothetical protein QXP68_01735 [Thermosphaera sp.]